MPKPPPTSHTFSNRELATVLGALRHLQEIGGDRADLSMAARDVLTDGGTIAPLSSAQIDKLCEKLNT